MSASHKIRTTARLCKDTGFLNFSPNRRIYHSILGKSAVTLVYPYIHIFKCQKGISLSELMLLHSHTLFQGTSPRTCLADSSALQRLEEKEKHCDVITNLYY